MVYSLSLAELKNQPCGRTAAVEEECQGGPVPCFPYLRALSLPWRTSPLLKISVSWNMTPFTCCFRCQDVTVPLKSRYTSTRLHNVTYQGEYTSNSLPWETYLWLLSDSKMGAVFSLTNSLNVFNLCLWKRVLPFQSLLHWKVSWVILNNLCLSNSGSLSDSGRIKKRWLGLLGAGERRCRAALHHLKDSYSGHLIFAA